MLAVAATLLHCSWAPWAVYFVDVCWCFVVCVSFAVLSC